MFRFPRSLPFSGFGRFGITNQTHLNINARNINASTNIDCKAEAVIGRVLIASSPLESGMLSSEYDQISWFPCTILCRPSRDAKTLHADKPGLEEASSKKLRKVI